MASQENDASTTSVPLFDQGWGLDGRDFPSLKRTKIDDSFIVSVCILRFSLHYLLTYSYATLTLLIRGNANQMCNLNMFKFFALTRTCMHLKVGLNRKRLGKTENLILTCGLLFFT